MRMPSSYLCKRLLQVRRVAASAVVCIFTACSTPTEPPAPGLQFVLPAGPYRLALSPLVSPATLKCSESDRYLGVAIETFVIVTYDAEVLVARSTASQNGDMEMRIAVSGSRFGTFLVSGTARGTAIDRRDAQSTGLATLGFSDGANGAASLTGMLFTNPTPYLAGNATGTFVAESIVGRETCQYAQWRLDAL